MSVSRSALSDCEYRLTLVPLLQFLLVEVSGLLEIAKLLCRQLALTSVRMQRQRMCPQ